MTKFCHIFTPKRTKCSLKIYIRGSPRTYKKCTATRTYLYLLNMCIYFFKRKFSENVLQRPEHTKFRNQQKSVEYYALIHLHIMRSNK